MNLEQTPTPQPTVATAAPQRDKVTELILPVNRSGYSIAAGYFALVSFPFLIFAPIAFGLGMVALRDIKKHPERAGRGRAWFGVIYGGICSLLGLLWIALIALS